MEGLGIYIYIYIYIRCICVYSVYCIYDGCPDGDNDDGFADGYNDDGFADGSDAMRRNEKLLNLQFAVRSSFNDSDVNSHMF